MAASLITLQPNNRKIAVRGSHLQFRAYTESVCVCVYVYTGHTMERNRVVGPRGFSRDSLSSLRLSSYPSLFLRTLSIMFYGGDQP